MKDTWTRYAAWCRKQGGTAQCSPLLMVIGAIVVCGAIIYVYREVIITTLITIGIVVGSLAGTAVITMFAVTTYRWYRSRALIEKGRALAAPAADIPETASLSDAEAITEEADWLASGVELAFGPDGKLRAK